MAARTQRIYRKASLFENLETGDLVFQDLARGGLRRVLSALLAIVITGLLSFAAFSAQSSGNEPLGLSLYAAAGLFGLFTLSKILGGLQNLWDRWFHRPSPVLLDQRGIEQTGDAGEAISLSWEDIRVIQHKRTAHLVRGREKAPQIEISRRLMDHDDLSAFIEFAFLLRQEKGAAWDGLLNEVRARLGGQGFHFHLDRNREHSVHVDLQGITHTLPDGTTEQMDWDLMKESIFDRSRSALRFRHTGTQTDLTLPLGSSADRMIDHFIRWALHTDPCFE